MLALFKSDLTRRFTGGFLVGAIAMLLFQPPETAMAAVETLKAVIG